METYDLNVQKVMDFLSLEEYSPSVLSQHKIWYRECRTNLKKNNLDYSDSAVDEWLEGIQRTHCPRQYSNARCCMAQLQDVYLEGVVSPKHLGPQASAYVLLLPTAKAEIDEFISSQLKYERNETCRRACARFMLFLQKRSVVSVCQLSYAVLLEFHGEDYHKSYKSKDVYENHIRAFLTYHAGQGNCSSGLGLAMNKMLIPQIIHADNRDFIRDEGGDEATWQSLENFFLGMKQARYGKCVQKSSRHILCLMYIFLDMHSLRLRPSVLWQWFELVKPRLRTGWKQARRSLYQYLLFLNTGKVTTKLTGDPYLVNKIDTLPAWCCLELKSYLDLLKREGRQPSTLVMQKSSNLRFCNFLVKSGITTFLKLTPQHLQEFNRQDKHKTPEGKAAYNSRIRGFLIYLIDKGIVENTALASALPSASAPRTKIVEVLTQEEIQLIWSVETTAMLPKVLRDYAIVCVGLGMGFRASDISAIRYQDIDWKRHSISLIQQKTGKAISLPLPTKVGNVLFQYLTEARPESNCPYVFISHEAPYGKVGSGVCAHALTRFLSKRGKQSGGFHIVRKTFATNLLRGNVKVERITDALGHTTDETVTKYLSLDEEQMRKCSISLVEAKIRYEGGDLDV